jgi:hypothetical protein
MLCGSPTERFSDKLPIWAPSSSKDADFFPIDVLYGSYDPHAQLIEIFVRRIRRDAPLYGGTFENLLELVRLHEYVHAAVHVGVGPHEIFSTLNTPDRFGNTDWNGFIERRTRSFVDLIDAASHEFLAQAVAYACLTTLTEPRSTLLKTVFENLEKKQPQHYFVPEDVKAIAALVKWPLLLEAARQDHDCSRGPSFSLYEGLLALARSYGQITADVSEHEWTVPFSDADALDGLKDSFRADERGQASGANDLRFLVDRVGGLKIEIFAREHPPPHFRAICGDESANYRISNCTQLNGGLRQHYRAIRKWHVQHKALLIAAWNQHRPSDCPVGEYREP